MLRPVAGMALRGSYPCEQVAVNIRGSTYSASVPELDIHLVAIEPESGESFLGKPFDEAVKAVRARHPPACRTPFGSGIAQRFTWRVMQR